MSQFNFAFKMSADASDAIKAFRLTRAEQKKLADGTAETGVRMKAATNAAVRYKSEHALLVRSYKSGAISLQELNDTLAKNKRKMREVAGANEIYEKSLKKSSNAVGNLTSKVAKLVGVGALLAVAKRGLNGITDQFEKFEVASIGVAKTTDMTDEKLDQFESRILNLTRTVPKSAAELLNLAQTAGQLGVKGSDNLIKFTETVAKMESATDLAGDAAATMMSRILSVTGESIGDVDRFGAVIVELGNNFAATESEIARHTNEVSRATAAYQIGAAESAAWGASLAALGIQAELGSSSVGKLFRKIDETIRTGGDSLREMANIAGQSISDFQQLFETDASSAVTAFLDGLKRIGDEGGSITQTLDGFKLKGEEIAKTLPVLAQRTDIVRDALQQANAQWKEATALENEAAKASTTLAAKKQLLANAWNELLTTIGNSGVGDAYKSFIDGLTSAITDLKDNIPEIIGFLKSFSFALGGLAIAKLMSSSIALLGRKTLSYSRITKIARVNTKMLTRSVRMLRLSSMALLGPIGLLLGLAADYGVEAAMSADETDNLSDALDFNKNISSLSATNMDILERATEAYRQKSVEAMNQLKEEAKAHYAVAKATLFEAKTKSDAAIKGLESARNMKKLAPTFGASFFGGQSSADAMDKIANDMKSEADKIYNRASSALAKAIEVESEALKNLNKIGTTVSSMTGDIRVSNAKKYKLATEAANAFKKELSDLKGQLAAGIINQAQYNSHLAMAKKEMQTVSGATELYENSLKKTGGTTGRTGRGIKGLGRATRKTAKDFDTAADSVKKFNESLTANINSDYKEIVDDLKTDAEKLTAWFNKAQTALANKLAIGGIDYAEYEKQNARLIAEEQKRQERMQDDAKETTDVITEQFKRAVESIDGSFADMWKSVLSGGEVSFKSLADSAKNILAEVLHGVTTKPLTGWLTGLFSGESADGDKQDKAAKGIWNTLTEGFDKIDKTFSDGLGELLGIEDKNNKALVGVGKILGGAVVGAGIGGTVGGLMGGDALVSSLSGAAGGAIGKGIVSLFDVSNKFLSTAIPIVGSVIGSLIGGLLSRKKDKISRSVVTSDGSVTRDQTNDIKSSVSRDIAKQFWEGATSRANQYGVGFANDLATMVTYKTHRKGNGPMMWYFDLIKDTNRDGEGDQTLFNSSFQSSEKDPEKIAQAMAQMQIAALATADWSGVSTTIAEGMSIVSAEGMSTQQIEAFYTWIDRTMLITRAFGVEIGSVGDNLSKFGGSFEAFQTYTTATYDLVTRYGKGMVNDLTSYLKNTPDADWADTAQSLNVVTYGMELLGQKSSATNKQLIKSAAGITKSFGGAESAMKTYQAIFAATATETHKAGITYQSHKQRIDVLNQAMGFAGNSFIATKEQLAAFVAGLDPLSDGYAENMRWAGQMSTSLLGIADASKYFTSAIEGINNTIGGVTKSIREDMMTDEELYKSRKSEAEKQAASIASMTDVDEIKRTVSDITASVSTMYRSLSDEQKKAGMGDWMLNFLKELETLSNGRIEAIQNKYGADNKEAENYKEVEDAAKHQQETFKNAAAQQQQAAKQQQEASATINKAAAIIDKAAAVMSSAANLINKPVDVDVTVHQVAAGGEIN